MHEMGLCEAIVAATLREAGDRRVTGVRVRVGGHAVDPAVVQQGLQLAAAGTPAADAEVQLQVRPPVAHCRGCGCDHPATDALHLVACPSCGTQNAATAKFCSSCGANMAPAPLTCPGCQTQNPPGTKFCSNCGAALPAAS